MTIPRIILNNGLLVDLVMLDFVGQAGFVERVSGVEVAYIPNRNGRRTRAGDRFVANDRSWEVLDVRRSDQVHGMTILRLIPFDA